MKRRNTVIPKQMQRIIFASVLSMIIIGIFMIVCYAVVTNKDKPHDIEVAESEAFTVVQDYLTPNEYSRPQKRLKNVRGIVVHYTANPGTDAKANRDYFNGLGETGGTYASSHFVIGIDGTIIQCMPLTEIAYASNDRNKDTVSIECCHKKRNGKFTEKTYESLVKLSAWLCRKFDIEVDNVIRHYDVTGKLCPLYYVKHEDKWAQLKNDIADEIDRNELLKAETD